MVMKSSDTVPAVLRKNLTPLHRAYNNLIMKYLRTRRYKRPFTTLHPAYTRPFLRVFTRVYGKEFWSDMVPYCNFLNLKVT